MLKDFTLGRVDVSQMNFRILSLIPKVKGEDSVKQFRPITLINIIFKFIAKAMIYVSLPFIEDHRSQ
jgi:hypothetical protein